VAARELRGRTNPAAPHPPPLRRLGPRTSDGYAVADFAASVLGQPFHPWQRRAAILAGERRADGRLRYRLVLVVVGRRNGKSYLAAAHLLYRAVVLGERVLARAQNLKTAPELWRDACGLVMANAELAAQVVNRRESLGDETLRFANGGEYRLVTADERAFRGLTCSFLVLDELALQRGEPGMARLRGPRPHGGRRPRRRSGSTVLRQLRPLR
jgi:phage terminase large subunit-like protein